MSKQVTSKDLPALSNSSIFRATSQLWETMGSGSKAKRFRSSTLLPSDKRIKIEKAISKRIDGTDYLAGKESKRKLQKKKGKEIDLFILFIGSLHQILYIRNHMQPIEGFLYYVEEWHKM